MTRAVLLHHAAREPLAHRCTVAARVRADAAEGCLRKFLLSAGAGTTLFRPSRAKRRSGGARDFQETREEADMDKRFKLDVGSINVATFDTSRDAKGNDLQLGLITRSTAGICCVDTVCATKAECSTETCA
jgi:hypothetical protein